MWGTNMTVSKDEGEKIIRGVMRLAEDGGMENVNLGTLGASIDIRSEQILRGFPDIDALWCAVLTWMEKRLMDLLEHSAAHEHDAVAALEGMFKCHVSFISHHLGVVSILFKTLQQDDTRLKRQIHDILRRYEADLVAMICLGKAEGTIRCDVDAQAAARYFIALIQGLAVRMSVQSQCDRKAVLDEAQRVIALYLEGIRVRPVIASTV